MTLEIPTGISATDYEADGNPSSSAPGYAGPMCARGLHDFLVGMLADGKGSCPVYVEKDRLIGSPEIVPMTLARRPALQPLGGLAVTPANRYEQILLDELRAIDCGAVFLKAGSAALSMEAMDNAYGRMADRTVSLAEDCSDHGIRTKTGKQADLNVPRSLRLGDVLDMIQACISSGDLTRESPMRVYVGQDALDWTSMMLVERDNRKLAEPATVEEQKALENFTGVNESALVITGDYRALTWDETAACIDQLHERAQAIPELAMPSLAFPIQQPAAQSQSVTENYAHLSSKSLGDSVTSASVAIGEAMPRAAA